VEETNAGGWSFDATESGPSSVDLLYITNIAECSQFNKMNGEEIENSFRNNLSNQLSKCNNWIFITLHVFKEFGFTLRVPICLTRCYNSPHWEYRNSLRLRWRALEMIGRETTVLYYVIGVDNEPVRILWNITQCLVRSFYKFTDTCRNSQSVLEYLFNCVHIQTQTADIILYSGWSLGGS